MRIVLQRVLEASVSVGAQSISRISRGFLVFLAVEESDAAGDAEWLAEKILKVRIFDDPDGERNLSVLEAGGEILVVSQFTLLAGTRKGSRPSYSRAARPDSAIPLYQQFVQRLEARMGVGVKTGKFGADMRVALINDGPVTLVIDSRLRE